MLGRIKGRLQESCNIVEDKYMLSKLKNTSIYDTERLSYAVHNLYSKELSASNDYYGHAGAIKRYCGFDSSYQIKASVEHAFFFGKDYWDLEVMHNLPGIITQGSIRPEMLKPYTDKTVCPIGTYIQYADDSYYSEEKKKELKEKSGKTLLVFPMHSTHWVNLDYNVDEFINEIQKVSAGFDTVRVCMYWKDIIRKTHLKYKEKGFEIVSAGHIYDKNFLSRLKLIISTADHVMSNDVGSYVGQSVCLNKPVYLWRQEYSGGGNGYEDEYDTRLTDERYLTTFEAFEQFRESITEEQKDLCDKLWGVRKKLTRDELRTLLEKLESEARHE